MTSAARCLKTVPRYMRYPGRLLASGEVIPVAVSSFIAVQLGEEMDELCRYAETDVTRRRHLVDLRQIYGFKMFSGCHIPAGNMAAS